MLIYFKEGDEDLLDVLSAYNCKSKPKADNLKALIQELAHQELVQKPRYVSNCFSEVFVSAKKHHPFRSKEELSNFYESRKPNSKKVIQSLVCNPTTDDERTVFNHLTRLIKTLGKEELVLFIRFVTGGDLLPLQINIEYTDQVPRVPRATTCVNRLTLSTDYSCYNQLAEEFLSVLREKESFSFSYH